MQHIHLYDMQTTERTSTEAATSQAYKTTRQFDDAIALCRNLYAKNSTTTAARGA